MTNGLRAAATILAAALGSAAQADATLTYELGGGDGAPVTKTLAVSGFFARVDSSDQPERFLLFQAGKFFPLYRVDVAASTYTQLTPEVQVNFGAAATGAPPQQEPGAGPGPEVDQAAPVAEAGAAPDAESGLAYARTAAARAAELRPTADTRSVAGLSCRVIQELAGGEPVVEHCMANKASLGLTERETRTLARTLVMARAHELGWLGAATEDEEFVSIASRDLRSDRRFELKKISTDALAAGHLRVPKAFEKVPLVAAPPAAAEAAAPAE